MIPLELEAVEKAYGNRLTQVEVCLIAEVRCLREIVLVCHTRGSDGLCLRCWHRYPCPSAQAAGAT